MKPLRKYCFLIILSFLGSPLAYMQAPTFADLTSPNVGSLFTFNNVPVSYYTGTPDISIPIYTVKSGNIEVPISLRYHPANVKPNDHPGWVGLGWNLDVGGVITRVRHGYFDESNVSSTLKSYYEYGANDPAFVSSSTWNAIDTMLMFYTAVGVDQVRTGRDADEFFFSFPGGTGKFIYLDGKWEVISDQNIKVELDGFFDEGTDIQNYINNHSKVEIYTREDGRSRFFKGFVLTTEDGTKYYFGGYGAVEFYGNPPYYNLAAVNAYADTWHLKKIVDTNGNEVEFVYHMSYPVCKISYYASDIISSGDYEETIFHLGPIDLNFDAHPSDWEFSTVTTQKHSFLVRFPVYLDTITVRNGSGTNETVSFNTSISEELRYADRYFDYFDERYDLPNDWYFLYPSSSMYNKKRDSLQWEKLDRIRVFDSSGDLKHGFSFEYDNTGSERLSLGSLVETGEFSSPESMYTFEYNPGFDPPYGGDSTDHWGYYNARSIESTNNIYASKEPDTAALKMGILNKITYPTGGYTEFEWEANEYSKVVHLTRDSLSPVTGYAGGVRIKEIRSYTDTVATPLTKKYSYVLGYDTGGTVSSGVLNGYPGYTFDVDDRLTNAGTQMLLSYFIRSVNDMTSYSYNANESHIGYSEVTEIEGDGSFTRHVFTNYGPDSHGGDHFDRPPAGYIGWVRGEDRYFPMSSLEKERGKPLFTGSYDSGGNLLDRTDYYYDNSENRFNKYFRRLQYGQTIVFGTGGIGIRFSVALRDYTYRYNLLKEVRSRYDRNGQNPLITVRDYTYDLKDRVVAVSDSTYGDYIRTTVYTTHPEDYLSDDGFIDTLVLNNITGVPIERVTVKSDRSTSEVIGGSAYSYFDGSEDNGNGKGFPRKEYVLEFPDGNPIPLESFKFSNNVDSGVLPIRGPGRNTTFVKDSRYVERVSYDCYDEYGNLLQYHVSGDIDITYAWGYDGVYPVARFDNLSDSAFRANTVLKGYVDRLDDSGDLSVGGAREDLKALNDSIRSSLPSGVMVTTYTYEPLRGMSSQTDPNGITTYYEYDIFGRLEAVRDDDWNIVEGYDYHYRDQ